MARQIAHPPCDCLLNEPIMIVYQLCGPAQNTFAGLNFVGFGKILFRVGQGDDKGRAASPHMIRCDPCFHLIQTRRVGDHPLLPCHTGVIGNGPTVKIIDPAGDQIPDRLIGANARLGQ